jgi:anti-sigma factor RsiW
MTRDTARFTDDELQRYVDGELPAAQATAVAQAVAADPGVAARVAELQELHALLHAELLAEADGVDFSGLTERVLAASARASAETWTGRLAAWWREAVAPRRAVWAPTLALAAAAALVLTLPRVLDSETRVSPEILAANEGVEVRSLETGTSLAMVYQLPRSHTTVIWISDQAPAAAAEDALDDSPATEWGGQ